MGGKILNVEEYIDKKFNRLTILNFITIDNNGNKIVEVQCDCEKQTIFNTALSKVKNGYIKSCGCLRKDRVFKANKKYNTYNLTDEYGIGYTTKGEEFYFDLEDYNLIKDICWLITKEGYVKGLQKGEHIFMHNLVMNNLFIDHIHHNKNDNRKENLRLITVSQNMFNRKGYGKLSKFGVKGIYWCKRYNKWRGELQKNKKRVYLNIFEFIVDSIKSQIEAEKLHFGEYRYEWEHDIKWDELLEYEKQIKINLKKGE